MNVQLIVNKQTNKQKNRLSFK